MQVGEKERSYQMENVYKDIVRTIVDKCVDPATKKAYTTYTIERALRNIGFSVNLNKNVKSQVLYVHFLLTGIIFIYTRLWMLLNS